jgi:hypothetical protein
MLRAMLLIGAIGCALALTTVTAAAAPAPADGAKFAALAATADGEFSRTAPAAPQWMRLAREVKTKTKPGAKKKKKGYAYPCIKTEKGVVCPPA